MIYHELLRSIIHIDREYVSPHGKFVKVISPEKREGVVSVSEFRFFRLGLVLGRLSNCHGACELTLTARWLR